MLRCVWVAWMVGSLALIGCKDEPVQQVEPPLEYTSQKANYALSLSPRWSREDPATLNTYAEFAASFANTVYVIVIPQELPSFPNVDPPDSLALKRASMSVMEAQIGDLAIDRQGPVKVDGQLAQLVIAQGRVEGQWVKYATTYMTYLGWGYQVVTWGPAEHASLVIAQADEFLAGWEFRLPSSDPVAKEPLAPIVAPPEQSGPGNLGPGSGIESGADAG